ncbi:39S ribosomal protein L35, mitochondrial [Ischnura elegans]|uniref:39S ribosomal protein L35, mitochondrial n=1 Tax=Ischnura elegans TaxID=197161 RepID=UPI001ED892A4|nr:39S ribosomal protein L35, mitochondrial [Ischnura elegans]
MIRAVFSGLRYLEPALLRSNNRTFNFLPSRLSRPIVTAYSTFTSQYSAYLKPQFCQSSLLQSSSLLNARPNLPTIQPSSRTLTKFSLRKGKRKTVKAVIRRFFRLDWGIWIRTKAGRNKHMWKKSESRKRRLRQHVFCNATQSTLLDKMVTRFWKKRRYYIDDPYEPYHKRDEFWVTRKNPI